jgi:hypothetical protein
MKPWYQSPVLLQMSTGRHIPETLEICRCISCNMSRTILSQQVIH